MIIRQADNLPETREVHLKNTIDLGADRSYIVEISTHEGTLFIAAFDTETPESLLIELHDERAQDIMREF